MAEVDWALNAAAIAALPENERRDRLHGIKEVRRRMERHGVMLGSNDGANKETLREWLDGIERARDYCGANDWLTLELLGMLSQGPLARCVAAHLRIPENRTWAIVKAEIYRLFMNEEEEQQLRAVIGEILSGDFFSNGVFYLKTSIHLHKIEAAIFVH